MKKVRPEKVQARFAARAAGFTVLELMIAVAVLGILLGIGVPAFQGIIRQNRLAAQTNDLVAATSIARSEAVKRGNNVSICPIDPASPNNAPTCANSDAWSNGWIVFSDTRGAVGSLDVAGAADDDVLIQRWPASAEKRMTVTNAGVNSVTYRGDGSTTLGAATTTAFTVAPESSYCDNEQGARTVTITATGRVMAVRRDCP